jgi:uncharacterized protein YcfJ
MNKFILAATIATLSTSAFAEPKNVKIRDVYIDKHISVPIHVKQCYDVEVPMYETYERKGSAAEAITGGVIGGAVGNQFGSGSGKDVMTILGVIIGANAADKKETRQAGYRVEKRCYESNRYKNETINVYSHSVMTFYENGKEYEVEFQK